jgi:hypothetical protein
VPRPLRPDASRLAGAALVLGLAGWLCYLLLHSVADPNRSLRPQLESGTLLFVVAGLGFRIATAPRLSSTVVPSTSSWPVLLPIMWSLAIVLYWPAFSVGYLSDDFILVQQATVWHFGPVAPQLFRPLPLAIWSLLLNSGTGAVGIHALNVLLHGTNAYLTARIVGGWIQGRWLPILAGVVVLTSPLAPEAVAWGAGVFDVASTTLLLSAVLVARRYESQPTLGTRILLLVLVLAALLCKETAAIGPVLVGVDAWVRKAISKRLIQDLVLIAIGVGLIMGARMYWQGSPALPPVTKYRLQRVLFDSFGSLVAPWHSELFRWRSALFGFSGLAATLLLTSFFVLSRSARETRAIVAGALWVLVSLLPVLPLFYVSPALEGSRYLYLATVGWAAILIIAASEVHTGSRMNVIVAALVVLTIALAVYGTRVHLQSWLRASALRDRVLAAAVANKALRDCEVTALQELPQSVQGAYVFSNGAREAFGNLGLNVYVGDATGPCSFRWNSASSQFEPARPSR